MLTREQMEKRLASERHWHGEWQRRAPGCDVPENPTLEALETAKQLADWLEEVLCGCGDYSGDCRAENVCSEAAPYPCDEAADKAEEWLGGGTEEQRR